ncbi:hypothetical protein AALB39_04255 [Lachnospiraceae bacterium 54-53]
MAKYKWLEQCRDFPKIVAVFNGDMLSYFEKQLLAYYRGENKYPPVVCWAEGTLSTECFIDMCS